MPELIDRRESLSDLISPKRDSKKPIYNWHSFKHSYSKALVDTLIKEFDLKKGAWVMDPFCGGGTTLLACKEAGINSRGYDILPFSVFLTNVKTRNYDLAKLLKIRKNFRRLKRANIEFPSLESIPIAKKAFTPAVRDELIRIKQRIENVKDPNSRDFFNLGLLSILESVSKTSKAGGFLRLTKNYVRKDLIEPKFLLRIDSMISDVQEFKRQMNGNNTSAEALLNDARKLSTTRIYDAVITSPPYPNRHDYSRIYSLEMLFDFVKNNDELKSIRYDTLRSHVEAKKRFSSNGYIKPKPLTRLLRKVKSNGTNNRMVLDMLEGYFEDMYLALQAMSKRLKRGGHLALVISNVRFAGVNIPVDKILFNIGHQVGLNPKAIWIARLRGNSSQQMRDYSRKASRESIVVWKK